MYSGDLHIGDLIIPCAVLEDGTRMLSQSGFAKSLGGSKPSAITRRGTGNLPVFLAAKNLKPFIDKDLAAAAAPIPYQPQHGGRPALGVNAAALPKICDVWLKARDKKVLQTNQMHLAKQADIIMRGLAHVGIIALVDEATGYQDVRAREALEKILEQFIAQELLKWVKTFPNDFYRELFRLRNWRYSPLSVKRPIVVGRLTNNLVYERLAPGVLGELRILNPKTPKGKRKWHHHRWLTRDFGHPRLREHLWAVIALMKASANWNEFKRAINRALPKWEDLPLFDMPKRDTQEKQLKK